MGNCFNTPVAAQIATNINLRDNPKDISSSKIKGTASVSYSFGTWICVNSFQNNKIITYIDATNHQSVTNLPRFSLVLEDITENTKSTDKHVLTAFLNINNQLQPIVITENVPKEWIYVVMVVNTIYCDCYLNGKLIKSIKIPQNSPQISTGKSGSIKFGNSDGANGDIILAKVSLWDYHLKPENVWTEYSSGNGL